MFPYVDQRMKPRRQGDLGEVSALGWLAEQGYVVWTPFGHSPNADLIAERTDGELLRVQVKTSTVWRNGRYAVTVCTRGGNRSWSGLVKRFGSECCDQLFVHCADGRRWFIPASAVPAGTGILLGGPKYAAYEVSRGTPLGAPTPT